MRPFFAIRIEWNPADSQDESHRDSFVVRRTVARQVNPCPKWVANEKKRLAAVGDDLSHVTHAITTCIEDLSREAKWTLPDLIADVCFNLANNSDCLEKEVILMAEIAADGCDDEFLDKLQKIIDDERKQRMSPQVPPCD